jgi:hypothetical protein
VLNLTEYKEKKDCGKVGAQTKPVTHPIGARPMAQEKILKNNIKNNMRKIKRKNLS